jgi:RNA polymerase sigma-70 factor, ECF subfamily
MVIRRLAPVPPPPNAALREQAVPDWNDKQLLEALQRQDPRAGFALYDRLIRVVEWTILRVVGQRSADHEDLVQAAFEQIVVTLYQRRYAENCSLTSWASAISCHVALNALRTLRRRRALRSDPVPANAEPRVRTDLESQLAARQALERIRGELARMNRGRAEVLVLHEVNGLDLSEIATVLGISASAAQSRLSRGRRELLQRLGPMGEREEGV